MELSEMNLAEVNERLAQLEIEVREMTEIETVEKATEEKKALLERKAELIDLEERQKTAEAIQNKEVVPEVIEERKEESKMEMRNSVEYINAFANYIKTGNDAECRALLTENASGTVAVPDLVVSTINTAWDNEPILTRVKKTYLKGNVKIGFEISATGAVEHTEGGEAVDEETLTLGIATLTPVSIKKWISVSDEALDLAGEAFLQYIYSELAYQIAKKLADEIIADITAATAAGSATVPKVAVLSAAPALSTIAKGVALLSDEATNPIVIMNKATYGTFKGIQNGANYAIDVFDGLDVVFNNSLPAYDAASAGDIYALVGDLGRGEMVNFPNGQDIEFKFDDKVLMTSDLVRILGRMYAGHAVVAPMCFTQLKKPSAG